MMRKRTGLPNAAGTAPECTELLSRQAAQLLPLVPFGSHFLGGLCQTIDSEVGAGCQTHFSRGFQLCMSL